MFAVTVDVEGVTASVLSFGILSLGSAKLWCFRNILLKV